MPLTEAQKRAQKRYCERNKERIAERTRLYEQGIGRDAKNATNARWRDRNPDKVREAKAAWHAAQKAAKLPKPTKQEQFAALVGSNPDLSILDQRQRTIIKLYYGLEEGRSPQSDPQIAACFNTTRQNINLQRKQALAALATPPSAPHG